ncbi:hypothetical protein EVAR_92146_1 [Eumeta japonica]|uniref:Uncharacterized protein n=1 Tax=Eumeta variegata TaxID=151549 RepID=A0A4C1SZB3_EUMVA|nr:hypothetical protein EVAR_92146_1 [Eumeta japonica]
MQPSAETSGLTFETYDGRGGARASRREQRPPPLSRDRALRTPTHRSRACGGVSKVFFSLPINSEGEIGVPLITYKVTAVMMVDST